MDSAVPIPAANAPNSQPNSGGSRPKKPRSNRTMRPPNQDVVDSGNRYTIEQKVQALTLISECFRWQDVKKRTGMTQQSQSNLKKKAFERGYRPEEDPRILRAYVEDAPRSGRPPVITEELKRSSDR